MKRTYESIKDLQSRQREQQAIARLQMAKQAYVPRYNHGDRLKALLERSTDATVQSPVKPEPKKPKRKSPPKATVGGAHQCRTKFYQALREFEKRDRPFTIEEFLQEAGLSHGYLRNENNADARAELDRLIDRVGRAQSREVRERHERFWATLKKFESRGYWFKLGDFLKEANLSKDFLRRSNHGLKDALEEVRGRLPQPLFQRPTTIQSAVVGVLRANPGIMRTELINLMPALTRAQMRSALDELIKKGAVVGDRVKGRYYYRLTEFGEMGMKPGVDHEP